eukprot:XP_001701643.1 predicted protein [Chlamydomonas reinhardtii]
MGGGFGGGLERPATSGGLADRVNSAGRQSMSGLPSSSTVSTSMPSLPPGGGGSMRMRHSIAGSGPGLGLPKLDLPPAMGGPGGAGGGGGGGGGSSMLAGAGRRQSVPGSGLGSDMLSISMDLPPFPGTAADGTAGIPQAGLSPRTLLAPLRPPTASTPLSAGPFGGPSGAAGATAAFLEAAASSTSTDTPLGSTGRRRSSVNGGIMEAGSMPLLTVNDLVATPPLTSAVSHGGTCTLSPRRSQSLSIVGDSVGSGGAGLGGERGSGGVLEHSAITAATLLSEVNDDLQRAAGALQALHTPACRPRSAASPGGAAAAAAAAAAEMTTSQLSALSSSAPELHTELRSSLRRAFQVMRQELGGARGGGSAGGGGGGGGSAAARQLSGCVHECWATLDAFLEGTAELTNMLVNGLLATRAAAAAAGSGGGGSKQPHRSASRVAESERLADAQEEAEGLRRPVLVQNTNCTLRRQLEEMRGRLAEAEVLAEAAEARATTAEARAAAIEAELAGSGGGAGGASAGPRPPGAAPMASPPTSERAVGVSPRRGLHARDRRPDSASSNGSAGPAGASGGGADDGPSPSPPQKLFDRVGTAQRGQHRAEVVIEENDEEEEDWAVSPSSPEGRRRMLTMHTASFAEWVRETNSRRQPGHPGQGR